ncbi:MAG: type II toxin-antitoxin system prevent-host-death family antitoxin [Anaerolineae bacterium]|nr:type II toxin-antitoxin system prevent-host-death family antitoxin [Anaerolineae bacterium]
MKQISIVEARDHFTELVREVEENSGVQLTRRGKPVAVILSITEFNRLQKSESSFWDSYLTFRQQFDLIELAIEPETFADVRDRAVGRDVTL